MSKDKWDELADRDWSEEWERLPEAPPIEPRKDGKTAQITLRLPISLVGRIRKVARAKSLPYHALARSWIIEGLRSGRGPRLEENVANPSAAQLNLKIDPGQLDELKAMGNRIRRPYHRLARQWIEEGLLTAEAESRPRSDPPKRQIECSEIPVYSDALPSIASSESDSCQTSAYALKKSEAAQAKVQKLSLKSPIRKVLNEQYFEVSIHVLDEAE